MQKKSWKRAKVLVRGEEKGKESKAEIERGQSELNAAGLLVEGARCKQGKGPERKEAGRPTYNSATFHPT